MEDRSGAQEEKRISLVVKSPNQLHGDQLLEGVDPGWTVRDLKTHLSRVYPDNPTEGDQRVIYSGKLLPDHLHIRDVFRKTDTTPTVHLVCAVRTQPKGPLGARPKVKEAELQQPGPAPSHDPQPIAPEMRQRRNPAPGPIPAPAWPGTTMPAPAALAPPSFPTYSLYSAQQLLWLQQVYARQYYMQYHAAMAAAGSSPLAPPLAGPSPPPAAAPLPADHLANQPPLNNLPANQNVQADPAFINAGAAANQNLRMNAQGGPVMEDEEELNRDWLDWGYTAARLGVFLSIVYFYSSLSRFVLVMTSLLLMYLHTAGLFPFRRRALVRAPPPPDAQENQQDQERDPHPAPAPAAGGGAGGGGGEDPAAGGEGPAPLQRPLAAVLVPPHRLSLVWTAWLFCKAFISSLIPEAVAP